MPSDVFPVKIWLFSDQQVKHSPSLNIMCSMLSRITQPFMRGVPVTDGGKCRLDWMGRAKVLSVHHRKIIKRH